MKSQKSKGLRKIKSDKIVIKVGTSTLTHANGNLNLKRIKEIVRVISDIKNSGKDVVLVTSGAIGVGTARLKLRQRPTEVREKQAAAAIGQSILMGIYDKFFSEHNYTVGQILLTKDCITNAEMRNNAINTFATLLEFGAIPIVNENDTIVVHEIKLGDNDTLSAHIANLINADLLILLTDVDGLYDRNPNEAGAKLIPEVNEITDAIKTIAGGAGSANGTGGMVTKLCAVEIAAKSGTKTIITNGSNPALIYEVLEGKEIGTYFNIK